MFNVLRVPSLRFTSSADLVSKTIGSSIERTTTELMIIIFGDLEHEGETFAGGAYSLDTGASTPRP